MTNNDAGFMARWWMTRGRGQATLVEALELARDTGADLDDMVAEGLLIVEGGMARLAVIVEGTRARLVRDEDEAATAQGQGGRRHADTPATVPERAQCVLSDPKTPYSATDGQGDPTEQDGAGRKGPGKSAEGRIGEGGGKTAPGASGGQHGGYGAIGEGGR